MKLLRRCYQWFILRDSCLHGWLLAKYPRTMHALDASLEAIYKIVSHPVFAVILSLLLVPLVATGKMSIVVALPIAVAVLIALVWLARSERVRRLTVLARSVFVVFIGTLLAVTGLWFGEWALVQYRLQQGHQQTLRQDRPPLAPQPGRVMPPSEDKKPQLEKRSTKPVDNPRSEEARIAGRHSQSPALTSQPPPKPADLGLQFFGKNTLAFNFINFGNESAQNPKYWGGIWDLTNPYSYSQVPEVPQPLPIPATVLNDFVRPGKKMGTIQVLSLSEAVERHVKPGDKLFGLIWVTCLNCVMTRAYWLFFEVGKGGWYWYDASRGESPGYIHIPGPSSTDIDAHIDALIPPNERTSMPEKE